MIKYSCLMKTEHLERLLVHFKSHNLEIFNFGRTQLETDKF